MKTKHKRFILLSLGLVLLISLPLRLFAQDGLSWYFKKNGEHKQPLLDSGQTFINGYHCYYVDKNHGDDCVDKVIYLTFDAGYENGNVEKILDTLKEKNVKAAFFVLSHLITADTELVRRMADEGHLVCNHTMSHRDMTRAKTRAEFEKELLGLEKLYAEKIGGEMPKYYRPPEGRISEDNLKILEEMGYKTILWSFAYADWDNQHQMSPEKALEKLNNGLHNGEILLLHPTSATNAAILGGFLDGLIERGYRFGTLDEL
ncbi:MAG: polysaccharide deacetylase family protein [Clostridia bacterium]|nr:polysaccharide deacetylase family protein [Clostridia bacterium]